jgi:putative sterol carrier protein
MSAATHPFPSAGWAAAFREAVNASEAYRKAGAAWTFGAVALIVKADPAIGLSEAAGIWLDLHQGVCRDARLVSPEEAEGAPFCIRGEYARWKQVIRGQLEPIAGMMQRKLELKGQMTTIVRFVDAAKELVNSAGRVPTRFLDD